MLDLTPWLLPALESRVISLNEAQKISGLAQFSREEWVTLPSCLDEASSRLWLFLMCGPSSLQH